MNGNDKRLCPYHTSDLRLFTEHSRGKWEVGQEIVRESL